MDDKTRTIAALSSGLVPSGVAVIRVSGPRARNALQTLAGAIPKPRFAALCQLSDPRDGHRLDQAIVLFFPGPNSFTGHDVAEFHCHGGTAVVSDVLDALWSLPGIDAAQAGDFTRQAFINGKMDLTAVEGVADLIHATTRMQRTQALEQLDGAAHRQVKQWSDRLLDVRAAIEAELDFSDEDGVGDFNPAPLLAELRAVECELAGAADDPVSERLRDGFRVVLAGEPNAGKSTLMNTLVGRKAALVSDIAGTTRDMLEAPLDWDGLPVILTDTAGLRPHLATNDVLERAGMQRASEVVAAADCVIWMSPADTLEVSPPSNLMVERESLIRVRSKADLVSVPSGAVEQVGVSAHTGVGLETLKARVGGVLRRKVEQRHNLPAVALDRRRRDLLKCSEVYVGAAASGLEAGTAPLEAVAEDLRLAHRALGELVGEVGVERMLDRLFSRFCIGK
ncbi:MAG: tRNA uridine-5-carboxymethylaminomethyl(34) synthesis GTPase MnmE [Pseudomonadota bacterium]